MQNAVHMGNQSNKSKQLKTKNYGNKKLITYINETGQLSFNTYNDT